MNAQLPEKLQFLFEPHRYKVLWGGRGGAKSWGSAIALLAIAASGKKRILCARETQKSIADSVHKLLGDQIIALGLQHYFTVEKATIKSITGSEFIFAGLKHNVDNIKSLEGCDIVWVEEAQTVSKGSWDKLIPTIRKEGSEIWVTFNPELEDDDTYQRFVIHPPPTARVEKILWSDNPWFPDVLRVEMEHLRQSDPASFAHIWEGACKSATEGAVYAGEIRAAESDNRITRVPYDATIPVHTFWDLGFGDATSIWFAQSAGLEYHLIDYLESTAKPLDWYLKQMQEKPYIYGTNWLPWDGKAKELGSGRSIEERLRGQGRDVQIVQRLTVADGIDAARTVFRQCWFDREKCADGLQGLRHYKYGETNAGLTTREPVHDWASHPADAFRYFAVAIKAPDRTKPQTGEWREYISDDDWMN